MRRLLDPKVLQEDSLYKLHRQIVAAPKGAIDNNDYCEYLLLQHFTNLSVNTETRVELSMAACLVTGKEDEFWKLCLADVHAHPDKVLPRHVQEAALLFALKRQNPQLMVQIMKMVGEQGSVCQQFVRNQDLLNRLLTQPMAGDANTLADLCPGTYWNYYFNDARATIVYD